MRIARDFNETLGSTSLLAMTSSNRSWVPSRRLTTLPRRSMCGDRHMSAMTIGTSHP
ncbi:hypothetical protein JAAARDRAFT_37692 [Jaapia argillacea MUCL 33604]|uniref:Uncharacterized protein n=1 Tax=Jaapia argillacea MUCL 33604 TaxID=933084 RepID=A0A067PXU6_9AGAM|nr:hypothetical protein JAAARDRAFT_37692 [Jaapia argillacea MUCL 33604]